MLFDRRRNAEFEQRKLELEILCFWLQSVSVTVQLVKLKLFK